MERNTRKWLVLLGVSISAICINIDFTIVNTCLSLIQASLSMSMNQLQWLMTGFGIAFCALLTVMGRFADIVGRRRLMYLGVFIFGLSSLGAGLAHSAWVLIAMRFLQGASSAIIFPCATALIVAAFPEEECSKALSLFGASIGIGLAIGPVLGGFITAFLSWRWIFLINVPIIFVSLSVLIPILQESKHPENISIDWGGIVLLVISLSSLVFAISTGSHYGWFSFSILGAFLLCIFSTLWLIKQETQQKNPMLPLFIFKNPGFQSGFFAYVLSMGLNWTVLFLVPLYLHTVLGFNTGKTGLFLLPLTLMTIILPGIAGKLLQHFGARFIIVLLFAVDISAFAGFLTFNSTTSTLFLIGILTLYGASWGIGNGVGTALAVAKLPSNDDVGVVSGAVITSMNIVGIIVLALSTVLFHYVSGGFIDAFRAVIIGLTLLSVLILPFALRAALQLDRQTT